MIFVKEKEHKNYSTQLHISPSCLTETALTLTRKKTEKNTTIRCGKVCVPAGRRRSAWRLRMDEPLRAL